MPSSRMRRLRRGAGGAEVVEAGGSSYVDLVVANRSSRKRLDASPRVVARAVRLVWHAGRGLLVAMGALTLLGAATVFAQLYLVQALVRQLVGTSGVEIPSRVLLLLLALVAVTAVSQLLTLTSQLVQRLLGQRVLRSATGELLDTTAAVPVDAYESDTFFHHLRRVEQNGVYKPMEVVQALAQLLAGSVNSLMIIVFLATIDLLLIPLVFLAALPGYLLSRAGGTLEFRFALRTVQLVRERNYVTEVLKARTTAKELRSFEAQTWFRAVWDERWETYLNGFRDMTLRRSTLAAVGSVISAVLVGAVATYLVWRVRDGGVAIASAGAAVLGLRFLAQRAQETGQGLASLLEARLYLEDLTSFTTSYPAEPQKGQGRPAPSVVSARGVGYTYPGSTRAALRDVDLSFTKGQVVALVGPNGSGKTTLSLLMSGLTTPTVGSLDWDGVALGEADRLSMREHVCVVLQDFVRYQLSVRENVTVGRPADDARLHAALVRAGADGFVRSLPHGVDTVLSKEHLGGQDLSVGQWQRIALARAFFRDSPVVILDEPTSALDAKAEHALFASIQALWQDRTIILVSHRLANVRHADLIVVLDSGSIVESGRHDELMARDGLYSQMYHLQAEQYLDAGRSRPVVAP